MYCGVESYKGKALGEFILMFRHFHIVLLQQLYSFWKKYLTKNEHYQRNFLLGCTRGDLSYWRQKSKDHKLIQVVSLRVNEVIFIFPRIPQMMELLVHFTSKHEMEQNTRQKRKRREPATREVRCDGTRRAPLKIITM